MGGSGDGVDAEEWCKAISVAVNLPRRRVRSESVRAKDPRDWVSRAKCMSCGVLRPKQCLHHRGPKSRDTTTRSQRQGKPRRAFAFTSFPPVQPLISFPPFCSARGHLQQLVMSDTSPAPGTAPSALHFEVLARCSTTRARVSRMTLPHATTMLPTFMPVATQATMKGVSLNAWGGEEEGSEGG